MFNKDTWSEIYHVLSKNKIRTALTAFGILWGIFMLLVLLGSGRGLKTGVMGGMADFATNSFFIWPESTTMPNDGFPKGRGFQFTNDDTETIQREIEGVDIVAPRVNARFTGQGNYLTYKQKSGVYTIMGNTPEYNKIDPMNFVYGRYINKNDNDQYKKVVVIGKTVYENLFDKGVNPLGEYIKINGAYFMVIGVVVSKHPGGWGDNQNRLVMMPFQTMQRYYNLGDRLHFYAISAKPGYSAVALQDQVRLLLAKRHHIHPDDELAFGNHNMEKEFQQINGLMNGIDILIWIVGIMTLLAGAIGVSNIMLIVVKERTKEIGIKRAIGATPRIITSQIILESVTLTLVAGSFGLLLSVLVIDQIKKLADAGAEDAMFKNPQISFSVAVAALIIILISGIFAGLIPAIHATRIKPIEALKD